MKRASGSKLLAWRLAKGLTQKQAADLAKVDQPSWHQYEHGRVPRDGSVLDRLIKLTRGTQHALKLEDFAASEEERAARRAQIEARTVAKAS